MPILQTFAKMAPGEAMVRFPVRLPERNKVYQATLKHFRLASSREEVKFAAKLALDTGGADLKSFTLTAIYARDMTGAKLQDRLGDHQKKLNDETATPWRVREPQFRYLADVRRFQLLVPPGMAIYTRDRLFFQYALGMDGQEQRNDVVASKIETVYGYWNEMDESGEGETLSVISQHQYPLAGLVVDLLPEGTAPVPGTTKINVRVLDGSVRLKAPGGEAEVGLASSNNLLDFFTGSLPRGLEALGLPEDAIKSKLEEPEEEHGDSKLVLTGKRYTACHYSLKLTLSPELAAYANRADDMVFDLSAAEGTRFELDPDKAAADPTVDLYPLTVYAEGGFGARSDSYVHGLGFRPVVALVTAEELTATEFRLDTDHSPLVLYFSGKDHKIVTFQTGVIVYVALELIPSPIV